VLYAELQRKEAALREQKELYEALLQVQSDLGEAVIVSNGERIQFANQACLALFGYSKDELLALRSFVDLVAPEFREGIVERLRRRFQNDGATPEGDHYETTLVGKDGRRFAAEISAKAIRLADDVQIVALVRDVTTRKHTETARFESEERLRTIFESSANGMSELDVLGRYQRVNPAFVKLTGYGLEELQRLTAPELTHAQDRTKLVDQFQRLLRGELPFFDVEMRLKRRDETWVWVQQIFSAIRDADGAPKFVHVLTQDISERRHASQAQSLLASIVDSSSDGIASFSLDGLIRTWNPAMETLFGHKAAEVIGAHIRIIVRRERWEEQREMVELVLKGQRVADHETERVRKDGTILPVSLTLSPIRDENGNMVGISSIIRETSDKRRAEEQRLQLAREQSARVAAEGQRERFQFLADVSKTLSSSLDLPSRLASVTQLATPTLTDWCVLHLSDENGQFRQVAMSHVDATKIALAERLRKQLPPGEELPHGVERAIRTGQSELIRQVPEAYFDDPSHSPQSLRLLRELGFSSCIIMPLQGRTRTIGAISLVRATPGRLYGPDDLVFAEQFAQRAALAIENANLYEQRRRAEEGLRRLALIVEHSDDAIMGLTLDGIIVSCNPAVHRVFGYEAKDLLGQHLSILVPADRSSEFTNSLERIRKGEHMEHFETQRITKDGKQIDVSVSLSPVRDANGHVIGLSTINRDITERKRFETALRLSRAQLEHHLNELRTIHNFSETIGRADALEDIYRASLDALVTSLQCDRSAILLYDADGIMRFKSWRRLSDEYRKAAEGHSPWTRETTNPQPVLVPDMQLDPSLDALRPALEREKIRSLAFLPLVNQGRLLGKFMLYYDERHPFGPSEVQLAQTIASAIAFAIDRRRTTEELARHRALLQDFVDTAAIGMHWVGPDGRILWANRAELEMLGYRAEEYLSHHVAEFHLDQPVIEDILARLLRGDAVKNQPARLKAKDGSIRHVIINCSGYFENGTFQHSRSFTQDITEQKRAEDALLESEERFRTVAETARESIVSLDSRGTISYINGSAQRAFNYAISEIFGLPLTKLLPERYHEPFHRFMDLQLRAGKTHVIGRTVEVHGRRKDGSEFPVELSLAKWDSPRGTFFVGLLRDITEREKLQETRAQLASIVESSSQAILSTTITGQVTSWNPAAEKMYGYGGAEVVGHPIDVLVPADRREELKDVVRRIRRGERVSEFETQRRTKEGRVIDVSVTAFPLYDTAGRITGVARIDRDITDEKHARESLQLYKQIYDSAKDGIAVIDLDGLYVQQNEAHRQLIGFADNEIRGKTPAIHLGEPVFEEIAAALRTEGRFRGEVSSLTKKGVRLTLEISAFAIKDAQGKPVGYVGIQRDVSERKRPSSPVKQDPPAKK
jgi:PAS domain S-box-containing protein